MSSKLKELPKRTRKTSTRRGSRSSSPKMLSWWETIRSTISWTLSSFKGSSSPRDHLYSGSTTNFSQTKRCHTCRLSVPKISSFSSWLIWSNDNCQLSGSRFLKKPLWSNSLTATSSTASWLRQTNFSNSNQDSSYAQWCLCTILNAILIKRQVRSNLESFNGNCRSKLLNLWKWSRCRAKRLN